MTGISFATDVIPVTRPAWTVQRGDRIPDWSNATTHTVPGCRIQPASAAEVHSTGGATRDAMVTTARIFAPVDADIQPYDRISWVGWMWEVEGQPLRWRSPTGMLAHRELIVRRVEG